MKAWTSGRSRPHIRKDAQEVRKNSSFRPARPSLIFGFGLRRLDSPCVAVRQAGPKKSGVKPPQSKSAHFHHLLFAAPP
jgi:hypothetical protein